MSKSAVYGTSGADDIKATNNAEGTYLAGNGGDDILRGGKYNDILVGGEGSDLMYGGDGADTFRFYGDATSSSYLKTSGVDTDKIFDLTFSEGDRLDFTGFSEASANAVIHNMTELKALVDSSAWTATAMSNGNLELTYDFGGGNVENIIVSHAAADYLAVV